MNKKWFMKLRCLVYNVIKRKFCFNLKNKESDWKNNREQPERATVRSERRRQRNYSVFPRGLNVQLFCFCQSVPDFQIATAQRANSKNSTDSCTAGSALVRARVFHHRKLHKTEHAGDGSYITCHAPTTESFRQTQNAEGITVSLKSSGNEGFTAVRERGGVKTPAGCL